MGEVGPPAEQGSPARSITASRAIRGLLLVIILAGLATVAWRARGSEAVAQIRDIAIVHRVEGHVELIRRAAAESGVDACLLAGIMSAESSGRVDAVSSADALGLFQLKESSASDAARKLGLEAPTREDLLTDGALNARLAAVHVAWLFEHEGPDTERVLVAYNAGRTKLMRWIRKAGSYAAWRDERLRANDSEVLAYARRVLEFTAAYRARGNITDD